MVLFVLDPLAMAPGLVSGSASCCVFVLAPELGIGLVLERVFALLVVLVPLLGRGLVAVVREVVAGPAGSGLVAFAGRMVK